MGASNSLGAVQFLEYNSEYSDLLIDSNGDRIQLSHQYHRGEINFSGRRPDGFAEVNGRNIFFEYNGQGSNLIVI